LKYAAEVEMHMAALEWIQMYTKIPGEDAFTVPGPGLCSLPNGSAHGSSSRSGSANPIPGSAPRFSISIVDAAAKNRRCTSAADGAGDEASNESVIMLKRGSFKTLVSEDSHAEHSMTAGEENAVDMSALTSLINNNIAFQQSIWL
jgi:hypothetical protein